MSDVENLARRIEAQAAISAVPGQLADLEQIAREVRGLDVPTADWVGVWAELTGYVDAARLDGGQIDPAAMAEYLVELKRKALAPVREWMNAILGRP